MYNLTKDMLHSIDEDKFDDAVKSANFLAKNFIKSGRYIVDESWGPEGLLYLAESSYALFSIYNITKDPLYLSAIKSILTELRTTQKSSGGWALELGKYSDGIGFKVTDEIRRITAKIEDLPPTVAMLKTIADYTELTGDDSYLDMGDKAFSYLMNYWDSDYGSFLEKENNELMALRSNPRSYHLFSLIGIHAWRAYSPKIIDQILPTIIEFVKDTFESYDSETMPLVYGLHAAVLIDYCGDDYIRDIIKPHIDKNLMLNNKFKINKRPGAFGHRDGLRGIVTDEGHIRSAIGITIAMKFYDLKTGTRTYRDTQIYQETSDWIQKMRGDGFYYEFELIDGSQRLGYGSPGQYLPIWWILGKI
jgi:hypothetical protein